MNADDIIKEWKEGPNDAIHFIAYQELDEYPDLSWLGEYSDFPPPDSGEWYVDRREGIFYGAQVINPPVTLKGEDLDVYVEVEEFIHAKKDENPTVYLYDEEYIEDDDGEVNEAIVTISYLQIISEVRSTYDRNSCRYYIPTQHVPPNPADWAHVSPETLAKVIEEDGSTEAASIRYALEGYNRMEDYNRGDWYMTGVTVKAYINGVEVAENSLWGIESDCDNEYRDEIVRDLAFQCRQSMKEAATEYAEIAAILANVNPREYKINDSHDDSRIVLQECDECSAQFKVKYLPDGDYQYVDDPCECFSDFHPVDGPSISQWLEGLKK